MIDIPARYEKISNLSGGGMSDTVKCKDKNLDRTVVVKSLKPGVASGKLLDELSSLSAIRSRHVVQVLDVIKDAAGSVVGFVEEYIEGDLLDDKYIKDEKHALKVLYSIASGISDIHAHGHVHRDIKPDNMKIDTEGTLKIFDFGLAKGPAAPGTKVLYYTPGHTAPEAFSKASGLHVYSTAIDTFAFGTTAFFLLNKGVLPAELFEMPARLPIGGLDFDTLPIKLPKKISKLLAATVSHAPGDRPAMSDVCRALKRQILKNKHRLLITFPGKIYVIDHANPSIKIDWHGDGIEIEYDGFDFVATTVTGYVEINNIAAKAGVKFQGAAVIVLGSGQNRAFVTADISHPEVML